MVSRFSQVQIPRVSGNRLSGSVITKLAGLDMVSPVDEMQEGRTPEAKNFRLYENTSAGREVAVTNRKGPGFYINPLNETKNVSNESTSGASTAQVGMVEGTHAQPFVPNSNGRLSRIDLKFAIGTATSNLRIDIYDTNEDRPGNLLTSSSFLESPDNQEYATARFVNAIEVSSGTKYWMVLYIQDDGSGFSEVSTTNTGLKAWSGVGLLSASETAYSLNYKVYISQSGQFLDSYRFNREDGVNRTLAAYGTTMYVIDESTKNLKPLLTGLSSNASYYDFTNGDGKVFWVNGYDELTSWNGTHEDDASNLIINSSFDTDTTGWNLTSIARSTADKHTGTASLYTSTSTWSARYPSVLTKNKRYKISFWAKSTNNGDVGIGTNATSGGANVAIFNSVPTSWTYYETYYTPTADQASIGLSSSSFTGYVDDIKMVETGIEIVTHANLPKLSLIGFHKDRLFGVPTGDRNRLIFSENPGNPSNSPANKQWYNAWLSVSFIYVPRPKNGSPITAIIPFQDNLIIFTQDRKYSLSGSDRGNYFLREATGNEGALSPRGVISDANYIYFTTPTGINRWNGARDEELSTLIKPLYMKCPNKHDISLSLWRDTVRAYMNSAFSTVKDITAVFDSTYNEWMLDTDTYVSSSLHYDDVDDEDELIEFSSQIPIAYVAEQAHNSLGAPIDFDYRLRYDSRGIPGQRKKFKKYVPLVQSVGKSFPITYGVDKDFEDTPKEKVQPLNVGGAKIGSFILDGNTLLTGATAFKPRKTAVSGYSYYMQFRVKRNAVNNEVAFMGVQFTYKAKKL